MTPIRAVLFDLDGVIRHFDSAHTADVERRHGLNAGEIFRVAFAPAVLDLVTMGRITRRAWVAHVGAELDNAQAAEEWSGQPTRLDEGTLALVGELRAAGIRTAILTNGTDTIPAEVADMGIGEHFEAIFNSAEIGWMKPDVRAFQHVLDALGLAPAEVFFTDDSPSKLVGAQKLGMPVHQFCEVDGLRAALCEAGVRLRMTE